MTLEVQTQEEDGRVQTPLRGGKHGVQVVNATAITTDRRGH